MKRRLPTKRPPTHPGQMLLQEFLKPLGVTQSALAVRLRVSFPRLNEVIRGRRSVTPDTALRLARVIGMSADFWKQHSCLRGASTYICQCLKYSARGFRTSA